MHQASVEGDECTRAVLEGLSAPGQWWKGWVNQGTGGGDECFRAAVEE